MEIGEAVAVSNQADMKNKDLCPLCYKSLDGHNKLKKTNDLEEVVSHPEQLKCDPIPIVAGAPPYTTAAHHLIPALQAYNRVHRIVRMGQAVGYDINAKPNGLPLPTCLNPYHDNRAYGDLPDDDLANPENKRTKQAIAEGVMVATGKQWHVGSHNYKQPADESSPVEGGDKELGHEVSYESSVIRLLLELCNDVTASPVCETKTESTDFIGRMNQLSADIADALDEFGRQNPWKSRPFFVSRRAYLYAKKHE